MNKLRLFFTAVLLSATTATAQLPNGSTAPNWTYTDLNGNSWTLYDLTAAGKTVFIEVMATWCPSCWSYHNTGALKNFYNLHGPNGTLSDEVMVFMIDADPSTTIADLYGTGGNTMGNWTAGTPFPIIDPGMGTPSQIFNNNYDINAFPTTYKVCSNNKIYNIGSLGTSGLINSINSCPFAVDAYTEAIPSLFCSSEYAPSFLLSNNGQSTLTSCDYSYEYDNSGAVFNASWSGSLGVGQSTTITLPTSTFGVGSHTMKIIVSNPNGMPDENNANDVKEFSFVYSNSPGHPLPYFNDILAFGFPYYDWTLFNPDNDVTWERINLHQGCLKFYSYDYPSVGEKDEFRIQPLDLTGLTTPTLNFQVAHARYSATYTERLEVQLSVDCGVNWVNIYDKQDPDLATVPNQTSPFQPTNDQWRGECIDLSPYIGYNKVYVKFVATTGNGNSIYLDNIELVTTPCLLGEEEITKLVDFDLYPNPATDEITLEFDAQNMDYTITITDLQGREVTSQSKTSLVGTQKFTISLDNVAKGSYIVTLSGGGKSITKRIIKE